MLKRHEDALMQRFDVLANVGFVKIEWWELYQWYGQQRIGKSIWRDLRDRFLESVDDEKADLFIYSTTQDLLLVSGDKLENVKDKVGATEQ